MACALLIGGVPRIAGAEWHITPFIGLTLAGKTTIVDPQFATDKRHVDFGGAVTLLGPGILGAEALVVFTPRFFQAERTSLETDVGRVVITSSRSTAVMANAVLTTPRRWTEYSLRPFVSGGFGLLRVSKTEENDVLGVHLNLAGFNIGGGAVGFLSQRTGVRFDVRYFRTVHDTDHGSGVSFGDVRLSYMTATIGVVIRR